MEIHFERQTSYRPIEPQFDLNFALDLMEGFSKRPKSLSSKYLYDERGSELFNQITMLNEYYVTRTEKEILHSQIFQLADLVPTITEVIELGGGDGTKAEIILNHLLGSNLRQFTAVDISELAIEQTLDRLRSRFSTLNLTGHVGDYFSSLSLPPSGREGRRLFLYLGSNIGNFEQSDALLFLRSLHSGMSSGDSVLIGFDLKKDISVLTAAYNDQKGVTAEFNLNLLDRINRELGGEFQKDLFFHHEYYNPEKGAMQSYLVSKEHQSIPIHRLHKTIEFEKWEPIHIEDSFKYSIKDIENLAHLTDFQLIQNFTDAREYFCDSLWIKP